LADLDQDGQAECLLADSKTLAVIDPLGGRLVIYSRSGSSLHQLVARSRSWSPGSPSRWSGTCRRAKRRSA
jgi:hypothetical protein